jgi:predicted nucleotidyltransferase
MTPQQQAILDQVTAALAADARVRSAWLSGSLARGGGDRWSDVDVTVVIASPDLPAVIAAFQAPRPDLPAAVFSQMVHGRIVSTITLDWERFDLTFLTPGEFAAQDGTGLMRLFGDGDAPPPRPTAADAGQAARVAAIVHEFIRVLGLLPVAVGREEWIVAQQGYELMRKMAVDLMLEANAVPPGARGAKRLNAYLSPDQQAALEALSPPAAARGPILASNRELAALFFAEARPLAARLAIAWPAAFEAATRTRLNRELSLGI